MYFRYKEVCKYNFRNGGFTRATGHFTQVSNGLTCCFIMFVLAVLKVFFTDQIGKCLKTNILC